MAESTTIGVSVSDYNRPAFFATSASGLMRDLEAIATEIAVTNISVLVLGESGTGKQALTRVIHELSLRCHMPIVQIACGAVTAERLMSQAHPIGDDEAAIGTIVFDEISELDRECQRKLLHMLPDGEREASSDRLSARIVSTSSQPLESEIRGGRFRNDLYHRLNGVCIRIPPLRERHEDIPVLFNFFLSKHSARMGKRCADISSSGMARLTQHSWPGNVRELENVALKVVALGDERLALEDLHGPSMPAQSPPQADCQSLKAAARAASREAERELILKALSRTRWNRKRAAQELQISYKSLLYKLKQIGLPNSESE